MTSWSKSDRSKSLPLPPLRIIGILPFAYCPLCRPVNDVHRISQVRLRLRSWSAPKFWFRQEGKLFQECCVGRAAPRVFGLHGAVYDGDDAGRGLAKAYGERRLDKNLLVLSKPEVPDR